MKAFITSIFIGFAISMNAQNSPYSVILFDMNGAQIDISGHSVKALKLIKIMVIEGEASPDLKFEANSPIKVKQGRIFVHENSPQEFKGPVITNIPYITPNTIVTISLDVVIKDQETEAENKIELKKKYIQIIAKL